MLQGDPYKFSSTEWKRLHLLWLFGEPNFAFHPLFVRGMSVLVSGVAQVQFPTQSVHTGEAPDQGLVNSPFRITVPAVFP